MATAGSQPAPESGLVVDAVSRWGVGPVSFTAEAGQFVVLAGPSGSGKSTLVGTVAGFDRPDAGQVRLDGENIHRMPRARLESRVGWLGAVIVSPSRAQRTIPLLVLADEPDAPFAEDAKNVFAAQLLNRRLMPLLRTIRALCDRGATVVVGTHSDHLVRAADRVVRL